MTDQTPAAAPPQPDPVSDADKAAAREALSGSDVGSDTTAGSLEGGASTGSEHDEAQAASDEHLAEMGRAMKAAETKPD
mgnify:CR=1 FL=1